MSDVLTLFMLAGESSGDRLGAALMRALKAERPGGVRFVGVGGVGMTEEGLEPLFPISEIAVMGLTEVLPRLPTILRRMRETREAVVAARPDALVTIDAPAFGLRVAKQAKPIICAETALIHYVAPSVWAWRPKRAAKLAAIVDHLLALLPFEPPYFEKEGLSCDFVGHPVAATPPPDPVDAAAFRAERGIAPDATLVAVLPGSRRSEVSRLGPVFGAALEPIARRRPNLEVIVPAAENVADEVAALAAEWPFPAQVLDPRGSPFDEAERRKRRAMAAADAALAASGTVSLELAAARTPMVIAYRVSALSAAIARRLIKVDTATLVNLVSETRTVPEFLQERCRPDLITPTLDRLLARDAPERNAQLGAADLTLERLGRGGEAPSVRAARSVLAAIARKRGASSASADDA